MQEYARTAVPLESLLGQYTWVYYDDGSQKGEVSLAEHIPEHGTQQPHLDILLEGHLTLSVKTKKISPANIVGSIEAGALRATIKGLRKKATDQQGEPRRGYWEIREAAWVNFRSGETVVLEDEGHGISALSVEDDRGEPLIEFSYHGDSPFTCIGRKQVDPDVKEALTDDERELLGIGFTEEEVKKLHESEGSQ